MANFILTVDSPDVARLKQLLLDTKTETVTLKGQLRQLRQAQRRIISASNSDVPRARPLVRYAEKYGHLSAADIARYGLCRAIELEAQRASYGTQE